MITMKTEPQSYAQLLETFPKERGTFPKWLRDIQQQAYGQFEKIGFPTRKQESWKYIPLDVFLKSEVKKSSRSILRQSLSERVKPGVLKAEILNGKLEQGGTFGHIFNLVGSLLPSEGKHFSEYLAMEGEQNPFALINTFQFEEVVIIQIPPGLKFSTPITINLTYDGFSVIHPRLLMILGEDSQAEIILNHFQPESGVFINAVNEVHLAKSARLTLYENFNGSQNGFYFINHRVHQNAGSEFKIATFSEGAKVLRQEIQTNFRGADARCELSGISFLEGESRFYQHLIARHHVSGCHSRHFFKNILTGKSQAEWNSLVYVVRDAQKTESIQLNKNLLLSKDAHIYSRPQLKIYADDVRCAHGSATGSLDEDEIFYLRSRGLNRTKAQEILAYGFAEEVLAEITIPALHTTLQERVQQKLDRFFSLKG